LCAKKRPSVSHVVYTRELLCSTRWAKSRSTPQPSRRNYRCILHRILTHLTHSATAGSAVNLQQPSLKLKTFFFSFYLFFCLLFYFIHCTCQCVGPICVLALWQTQIDIHALKVSLTKCPILIHVLLTYFYHRLFNSEPQSSEAFVYSWDLH